MVSHKGKTLLFDPWLVGSCYWRSWWNYPKVDKSLIEDLKPDFIFITHLHWDHFHGPSLRKFSLDTPVIVPKLQFSRMKDDLNQIGFKNIIELDHGGRHKILDDFEITSYQFNFLICDSAVVVQAGGVTLLNANDAKFMGLPLKQIMKNHPKIDFVFRSHSSANERLCYEVFEEIQDYQPDEMKYIESFRAFCERVGARYAVPFASNNCHLHPETMRFNKAIQTPLMVRNYFKQRDIRTPELKIMIRGDSWSEEGGFVLQSPDSFYNEREKLLESYQAEQGEVLRRQDEKEGRAKVTLKEFERYFIPFMKAVPFFLRRKFKGRPITFVFRSKMGEFVFQVDLYRKKITQENSYSDNTNPLQIHAPAFIGKQALALKMVDQMAISKRIRFRSSLSDQKLLQLYTLCHLLFEHHLLPILGNFKWRSLRLFLLRWREAALFLGIAKDLLLGRRFQEANYL